MTMPSSGWVGTKISASASRVTALPSAQVMAVACRPARRLAARACTVSVDSPERDRPITRVRLRSAR